MVKVAKDLFGVSKHIPCFAHTVNFIVENSIKNTKLLPHLSKIREIVIFLKKSTNISDELRKKQIDEGKILISL